MPSVRPIGQQRREEPAPRELSGSVRDEEDGGAIVTLPAMDPPDLEPDLGGDEPEDLSLDEPTARGPPGRQRFERDDGRPPRRLTADQRVQQAVARQRKAEQAADQERQRTAQLQADLDKATGIAATADEAAFVNWGNAVAADLQAAKREYAEAVEAGDAAAQADAQVKIAQAAQDSRNHERLKAQREAQAEQRKRQAADPNRRQQTQAPPKSSQLRLSPTTKAYVAANDWFDDDDEARGRVYQLHEELTGAGIAPDTAEYFAAINQRLRKERPDLDINDHPGAGRRRHDDDVIDGGEMLNGQAPRRVQRGPAPVSRNGGESIGGGQVSATRVRLTPEQREAARITMPGLPAAEREKRYAASLVKPGMADRLKPNRR